jgi:hypothetical protein
MSPNSLGISNYLLTNLQTTNGFLNKLVINNYDWKQLKFVNLHLLYSGTKNFTNLWTRSVISDNYFYEMKLYMEIDTGGARGSTEAVASC